MVIPHDPDRRDLRRRRGQSMSLSRKPPVPKRGRGYQALRRRLKTPPPVPKRKPLTPLARPERVESQPGPQISQEEYGLLKSVGPMIAKRGREMREQMDEEEYDETSWEDPEQVEADKVRDEARDRLDTGSKGVDGMEGQKSAKAGFSVEHKRKGYGEVEWERKFNRRLDEKLRGLRDSGPFRDFLLKSLLWKPENRFTVADALKHKFLKMKPDDEREAERLVKILMTKS